VAWTDPAQNTDKLRDLVNTVMNIVFFFIKCREFLEYLRTYLLIKKDFDPWSLLCSLGVFYLVSYKLITQQYIIQQNQFERVNEFTYLETQINAQNKRSEEIRKKNTSWK